MERRRRLVTRTLPLALVAIVAFVVGAAVGAPGSPQKDAANRFAEAWARDDFAAMYEELNDASQAADQPQAVRRRLPRSGADGDPARARTGLRPRPRIARRRDGRPGAGGRHHRRLRPLRRGARRCPSPTAASPGNPASSSPACARASSSEAEVELAPRAPILADDGTPLAEGPADEREHPLGSADDRRHRRNRHRRRSGAADARPARLPADTPVGDQRPREGASTSASPASPAARCYAVGEAGHAARPRPVRTEGRGAGEDDDRPRDPGSRGRRAGRAGGRHRRPRRPQRRRPRPRRPGLLGAPAAGLDLQDRHHHRRPAERRGLARRRIRNHRRGQRRRPLHRKRQRRATAAAPSARPSPSPATPTSPRSAPRSATTTSSPPPNASASTRRRPSTPSGWSRGGRTGRIDDPDRKSAKKSTSASRRSARAKCRRRRCRWRASPRRSPTTASASRPRSSRTRSCGPRPKPVRVMSKKIADELTELMVGVVVEGTGTAGAIAQAQVAGKTGTAELGPKPEAEENEEEPEQRKDAWFAAFAPAEKPKLAIGVLLIEAEAAGGEVAAPGRRRRSSAPASERRRRGREGRLLARLEVERDFDLRRLRRRDVERQRPVRRRPLRAAGRAPASPRSGPAGGSSRGSGSVPVLRLRCRTGRRRGFRLGRGRIPCGRRR